ncbi:MAG: hypothetical protein ACU83O_06485, partial [Gammaproteobacteria bacterium]
AFDNASSRLKAKASCKVIFRLSINSSWLASWQLTPGISLIQPSHQSPSCFISAVYFHAKYNCPFYIA